jgi:hypothetical protein
MHQLIDHFRSPRFLGDAEVFVTLTCTGTVTVPEEQADM